MLQIHNLHATVADKPILKGLTLALGVAACHPAAVKSGDCAALFQLREREVGQAMKAFNAAHPSPKVTDADGYPTLKRGADHQELQARLEVIESRYRAECPETN